MRSKREMSKEMKCPKCSYPRAKYRIQNTIDRDKKRAVRKRKRLHKTKRPKGSGQSTPQQKPREDWRAYCPKCRYKWEEKLNVILEGTK